MDTQEFPSKQELAIALSPRALKLMILPTEQCNFRCVYCYQDFQDGKMQPKLVEGIKRLIDRRMEDITYIALSWFGGEPLVAKDIVFEIAEHVDRRCREHGVTHSRGVMTTNGYLLTPSVMERLTKANQTYFQISLDGLGETHNLSRPLMSGKGSFDTLWNNLLQLRQSDYDFEIELRLHFGGCELTETEALCREINRQFGGDKRFTVYVKCIENYGGPNSDKITPLAREIAEQTSEHLLTLLPDLVTSHMYQKQMREICYAAHPNNLLIRADGRIGKCALALKDPCNTIGHLDGDGRLHIDNERFKPWIAGFKELDEELLTCPYNGIANTPAPQVITFS